jgi:hypothetical protein
MITHAELILDSQEPRLVQESNCIDRALIRTLLVSLTLLALAVGCGSGTAGPKSAIQRCAPPRGPGDSAVHSTNLRVKNISCSVGRQVALACVRFTYAHSGVCSTVGYRWRCTSTNPPGLESAQSCLSGPKSMSILWTD